MKMLMMKLMIPFWLLEKEGGVAASTAFVAAVSGGENGSFDHIKNRSRSLDHTAFHMFISSIDLNMTSTYLDCLNTISLPPPPRCRCSLS